MPKPKWRSGMPVEPIGLRWPSRRAQARGAYEMPDGVADPAIVAGVLAADYRRAESLRRMAHRVVPGQVVTLLGSLVPAQEIRERERLFAAVRRGDRAAAQTLWETRRAWIEPAGKGGRPSDGTQPDLRRDEAPPRVGPAGPGGH